MACWKNFLLGLGFVLLLFFGIPLHVDRSTSVGTEKHFAKFLKQFNKSYDNETEYRHHYRAFQDSLKDINKLNSHRKHNLSAVYGLTKYSDMTPEEFLDKHLQSDLHKRIFARTSTDSGEKIERNRTKRSTKGLPLKIDWREKGVVTKVNNQKLCGACWAFSTIQNMESMYAIKTGKLMQLSVQQLIDCTTYNDGCKGGDSCLLLQWLKDYNVKVNTEEVYPLHLRNEQCKQLNNSFGVQIDKFACVKMVDRENDILLSLAKIGPVAVAINALTWQNYLGGVIQFHCGDKPKLLNHAVQIVGYDLSAEIPHYIVRNSWGEEFGDKGYLYIAIGKNLCGLANEVSILTVL